MISETPDRIDEKGADAQTPTLRTKNKEDTSIEHVDKHELHPDLAPGPLAYTHAEFNSAHLTDAERALHSKSDNIDGAHSCYKPLL